MKIKVITLKGTHEFASYSMCKGYVRFVSYIRI